MRAIVLGMVLCGCTGLAAPQPPPPPPVDSGPAPFQNVTVRFTNSSALEVLAVVTLSNQQVINSRVASDQNTASSLLNLATGSSPGLSVSVTSLGVTDRYSPALRITRSGVFGLTYVFDQVTGDYVIRSGWE